MQYEYIIFDADHTVIDFDEDEKRAFRAALDVLGRHGTGPARRPRLPDRPPLTSLI